jgi:hypothetical protein
MIFQTDETPWKTISLIITFKLFLFVINLAIDDRLTLQSLLLHVQGPW